MDNNENPIQEFGTNNVETEIKQTQETNVQTEQPVKTEQTIQTEQPAQTNTTQQTGTQASKMNPYALASFICSLVGLLVCGLPLGIAAIITSVNANSTFKPETENNKWMATFGMVLGIIDIVCVIFYLTTIH